MAPILLGACGWNYPDWVGVFYPIGTRPDEQLTVYADHFPIVEVDSTFYGIPSAATVRSWARRVPDHFRFTLKAPRTITHDKKLQDCQDDVAEFVRSLEPLGGKLFAVLLQFGYLPVSDFPRLENFLDVLDPFLAEWPKDDVPLAVELRNPRWITAELAEVLRDHRTALALTAFRGMPTPAEVEARFDPLTGPFSYVRLMGDREKIERVTRSWDKLVLDRSAEVAETAEVINRLAQHVPVAAFAANHYAGHSPATLRQLRDALGLPEMRPEARPQRTLFDLE